MLVGGIEDLPSLSLEHLPHGRAPKTAQRRKKGRKGRKGETLQEIEIEIEIEIDLEIYP